jgi:PAS domain S-box-containing protein
MAGPTPTRRRVSQDQYRKFFENANDACALFALDGTITAVNRGAERLLGYARAELIGQHVRTVATPASVALAEDRARRFFAGEKLPSSVFAAELVRKDGSIVPVEARTRVIRDRAGRPVGFQGIYRDLTERTRLQEALRRSEARYRSIFEACPDFVYLTDPSGRILDANPALVRWAGFPLAELQQKHFLDFFAGENRAELLQTVARLLRGHPVEDVVVQARNVKGEIRTFEVNAIPVQEQGAVTAVLSVARDITRRAEAERKLRATQELQQHIADTIPAILYLYDLTARRLVYVNRQLSGILGYPPARMLRHSATALQKLVHPDDLPKLREQHAQLATLAEGGLIEAEYRVRYAGGEWRWLQTRTTVSARTAAGVPTQVVGTAQDITPRKQLEALLGERTIRRQEMGEQLRKFRERLRLAQHEFGKTFGGYDQQQVSLYERGKVDVPLDMLLAIRAQGFPLEVVLGAGTTAVIDETVGYLSSSHRVRVIARQLVEVLGRLLEQDTQTIERLLRDLGIPQSALTRLAAEQQKLLAQLAALEKTPG